jgi:hypothetical protein
MAPTLVCEPFHREGWVFEEKVDGWRMLAYNGASVFWIRRQAAWPDERVAVEFWQVKRGGGRRGIVEILREAV